jgi:hypothetical protein
LSGIHALERALLWMLLLGGAGGLWWLLQGPPLAIRPADGVLARDEPVQSELSNATPIVHGDFQLQPLASFQTQARVLSTLRYHLGTEAQLSPIDFALGWGPMSDNRILDQLDIEQSSRYLTWRWPHSPPLPAEQLTRSAANIHMIPSSKTIARQLKRIPVGAVVELRGLLVEVTGADGWTWRSSLRRDDSGRGACEVLWVESISVRN